MVRFVDLPLICCALLLRLRTPFTCDHLSISSLFVICCLSRLVDSFGSRCFGWTLISGSVDFDFRLLYTWVLPRL